MSEVEAELDIPKSKDLSEQAIDLEDDEMLETLGRSAEREVRALKLALERIDDGTYGICTTCGGTISSQRLVAVPFAMQCKSCAVGA